MIDQDERTEERYNILIVDDDQEVLNLLQVTLENADEFESKVVTAKNAEEAQDKIEDMTFDLVLADHKMPGKSGVELLSDLKEKSPETKRILITGYSALDIAKDAINKAKVDNYLEKPWDNQELRGTVYDTLKEEKEVPEAEIELNSGGAYLFKEEKPDRAFKAVKDEIEDDKSGLIISRMESDRLKEKYGLEEDGVTYRWLTRIPGKDNFKPADLEIIADFITRYMEERGEVVLLEGVESLIRDNSFDRVTGFMENIVDVAGLEEGILIVAMDTRTIDEKKSALLERNFTTF